jgi:tetratricopeptide (TPR) repeat protein
MRLTRSLITFALIYLAVIFFMDARREMKKEEPDMSKVVLYFGGVVLVGGAAGILVVLVVLPAVGDTIGGFFFSPNEKIEKAPHADAMAAIARGDYEAAVQEYLKAFEADPHDTLALSEMAKIECEQLGNPEAAADLLEQALQREWTPEDATFLTTRLVDVYWKYQHNARDARALLMQIIEGMPGTKHSANAQHKLQEIERALAMED